VRPLPGRHGAPAGGDRPRGSVEDELALLDEIARGMRDASICGLGQTAANAIESALRGLRPFRTEAVS
jgi:NADH:ubiquinone oxidoreductase subunit F (NADH-binding)